MAASQTPHSHQTGHKEGLYQQGSEDFGFDTPLLPDLSNPAPPCGAEDFGFDAPLPLQSPEAGKDSALRGNEDFGMDAPLPPEAPHSAGNGTAPLPDTQGDEDFPMGGPLPPSEAQSDIPQVRGES